MVNPIFRLWALSGLVIAGVGLSGSAKCQIKHTEELTEAVSNAADVVVVEAVVVDTNDMEPYTSAVAAKAIEQEVPKPPTGRALLAPWDIALGKPLTMSRTKLEWSNVFAGAADRYAPADATIAAGPAHLVVAMNGRILFIEKGSGKVVFDGKITQGNDKGFLGSTATTGETVCDPKLIYDQSTHRFVFTCIGPKESDKQSWGYVAVSDDDNPVGKWFVYRVDNGVSLDGETLWTDYPSVSVTKDTIFVSYNMFSFATSAFKGIAYVAIPKSEAVAGEPVRASELFMRGTDLFTMQMAPAADGPATYAMCVEDGSNAVLHRVTRVGDIIHVAQVRSSAPEVKYLGDVQGSQPDSDIGISPTQWRMTNASLKGSRLVCIHNVSSDRTPSALAPRWYEWDIASWPNIRLIQAGDVPSAAHEQGLCAAISHTADGSIGVLSSSSSKDFGATLWFSGRTQGDPSGAVSMPMRMNRAKGNYTKNPYGNDERAPVRWGDYFGLTPDPTQKDVLWAAGETLDKENNWGVWVGKLRVGKSVAAARPKKRK